MLDGRYYLGAELGAGAYGVVCSAVDLRQNKQVAVKTIDLELLPPSRRAFAAVTIERELEIMRSLDHPNVLCALDVVVCGGRRHIVLELCEGPSLQTVLEVRGALHAEEARHVLRQCLAALRHLHSRSIIHRDVKPGMSRRPSHPIPYHPIKAHLLQSRPIPCRRM